MTRRFSARLGKIDGKRHPHLVDVGVALVVLLHQHADEPDSANPAAAPAGWTS